MVPLSILLFKLKYFGFPSTVFRWFPFNLSGRSQSVIEPNDEKSESFDIEIGVPYGSVLGSLLFILFTVLRCVLKHSKYNV